ncbi:hypothetical protein COOONC_01409 [Cooperia oncophora]
MHLKAISRTQFFILPYHTLLQLRCEWTYAKFSARTVNYPLYADTSNIFCLDTRNRNHCSNKLATKPKRCPSQCRRAVHNPHRKTKRMLQLHRMEVKLISHFTARFHLGQPLSARIIYSPSNWKIAFDKAVVSSHCFTICGNKNISVEFSGILYYYAGESLEDIFLANVTQTIPQTE